MIVAWLAETEDQRRMRTRSGAWLIICCRKDNSLLLAKRAKRVRRPNVWNFFGGCLDQGESPEDAVLRELWEEARIRLRGCDVMKLGRRRLHEPSRRYTIRELHYYIFLTDKKPRPRLNREHSDYAWFTLDQFPQKLNRPTELAVNLGIVQQSVAFASRHPGG